MFLKILTREYLLRYSVKSALVTLRALKLFFIDLNFRATIYIYLCSEKKGLVSKLCRKKLLLKYGISIGTNPTIQPGLLLEHFHGIVIGNNVFLGKKCVLYQNVTIGQKDDLYPKIGDNVVIYPNATVVGAIRIGSNSIIGANSFVNHTCPEYSVIAGNPARIIKRLH